MIKIRLALTLLMLILTSCGSQPIKPETKVARFGLYGNWCGPDHPVNMSTAALPINELDASCMRHDMCYATEGKYACECDKILNEELEANFLANKYPAAQKYYARSFYQYFKGSWCIGTPDSKIGPSRALQNIYTHTSQKVLGVYDYMVGKRGEDSDKASAPIVTSQNEVEKK